MQTLHHCIRIHAQLSPDAPAIVSPEQPTLTYGTLLHQLETICVDLNRAGLGRGDVIAIVLPEGPEMTVAFLAVSCAATAAPLNPAYPQAEFEFFFRDLRVRALLTQPDFCPSAIQAACAVDIPILHLYSKPGEALIHAPYSTEKVGFAKNSGPAHPEDLLVVCYTSGTTARPKIVPLTHHNVCISAQNIARSLQLTACDRCLNVMPVFHIHGSVICTIASLASGGSVVAAPGFQAPLFLHWVHECRPTWYSAAPSIHQSILHYAGLQPHMAAGHSLRFIRSSAAAMPPNVMEDIEQTFDVPFIEGYGLSEAAHLLTSNFLPPFRRKRGSVGIAAGPEVAVMDPEHPRLLRPHQRGEIVARGPNIMGGYLNNPEANQRAFCDGWFRTGDQGYVDDEGYFYITGRIKELINRGGEKISPREIDEALLLHPDVLDAAAFPIPHHQLGEEVAAAVVLRSGDASEASLKRFLETKLAYFKIPTRILIVPAIPKGPTGKVQRSRLAEAFELNAEQLPGEPAQWRPPQPGIEEEIARVWAEVLRQNHIGSNLSFFSLGGDSILVGSLALRLQEEFGVNISLIDLFDAPTIAEQAALIQKRT